MRLPILSLDFAKWKKDPRFAVTVAAAALAAANLVAAAVTFQPWGASARDLEREAIALRGQIRQQKTALDRTKAILKKVEIARGEGDRFVDKYLLGQRSMASTLAAELERTARKAGIRQKDTTFSFEPVEGSEELTKAVVTSTYEGTYTDLMQFLNQIDRSDRLLIIESLNAAPQQQVGGGVLGVTLKLNSIVREGGPPPEEETAMADMPAAPAAAPAAPPAAVPVMRTTPTPAAPARPSLPLSTFPRRPVTPRVSSPEEGPPRGFAGPGEPMRGFTPGQPPPTRVGPMGRPPEGRPNQ